MKRRERYRRLTALDICMGTAFHGESESVVSVQSSDLPVTVESAQAVMAGLFPAEGNRIWADKGLTAWQPFYIHTAADSLHDMASSICLLIFVYSKEKFN
ncbi:hypothetical protein NECAME_15272 [Necator americanus]|uniref:Uncharacterized protein n=1 Tax=Necator americanus TaxID=51031 RepID=W2SIR5_NECAM|nr:hypothetical protein NECAME_15272 [Necator americanus]ETN69480.1 hypothetical protein NECAME_15272 [Necator americanus]